MVEVVVVEEVVVVSYVWYRMRFSARMINVPVKKVVVVVVVVVAGLRGAPRRAGGGNSCDIWVNRVRNKGEEQDKESYGEIINKGISREGYM